MKSKKILIIITFCFLLLILLTGCNIGKNKDAISSDKFCSILEEKGFTIINSNSELNSTDNLDEIFVAISSDYKYQIEFYKFESDSQAISSYKTQKRAFQDLKTNVSTNTEVELANYSKYTLISNGKYMVVSQIDDTLIYLNVDSDCKSEIDDILKDLGY